MLIYGKKDPLHEHHKTHEAIYSICRGDLSYGKDPKNAKLINSMKKELEETLWEVYGVRVDG